MKKLFSTSLAVAAMALAASVSHAAIITYTIALDDTTNSVGGTGHWGIYASTSGSPGGLAVYNYTINANAAIAQTTNLAPRATYTDSGGNNNNLNAGFTNLRTTNTTKAAIGSQDITAVPFDGIYDFGVSADAIPTLPPSALQTANADPGSSNGLGWDGEISITQASYGSVVPTGVPAGAVLLGKGTYTGAVGNLGTAVSTWFDNSTGAKNSGNVFSGTSGTANSVASSVVLNVVEEAASSTGISLDSAGVGTSGGTVSVAGSNGKYNGQVLAVASGAATTGSVAINNIGTDGTEVLMWLGGTDTATTHASNTSAGLADIIAALSGKTIAGTSPVGSTLFYDLLGATGSSTNDADATNLLNAYRAIAVSEGISSSVANGDGLLLVRFPTGSSDAYNAFLNYALPAGVTLDAVTAVPEPASLGLLALGGLGLISRRRRAAK